LLHMEGLFGAELLHMEGLFGAELC
jgi:hypothetical protein